MALGVTLLVVCILVIAIWLIVEFKRFNHKIFAFILIGLILFTYFGFASSIKGKEINFTSIDGIKEAGGLYIAWLGNAFNNVKTITANAINMNWNTKNSTKEDYS